MTGLQAEKHEGNASRSSRVVLISPCRDEERTLERTLASVEAQSQPPALWVVVDDGSTDRTAEILREAAARIPYLRIVRREDRGYRKVGGGVVDAFYAGLEAVDIDYDFIAKMDVDLEFPSGYLERCAEYFREDAKLAAVSGKVYRQEGAARIEEFMIDEMVAGQFKLYRREAFEKIGGFVREVMWDGIDFHRCRMNGLRTASIKDPELEILHLRLMGSSDRDVYRGRLRWGAGQWFMGSWFPYVVASGVFRLREKPRVIGGALIVAGYLAAALRGAPRYADIPFRSSLRRWQRARLIGLFRGQGARSAPSMELDRG